MEELRNYWEVPAVAHFCSLFRAVFHLIDFDIEDFEEALIVDTETATEGGRSSLIVDVLIALLRGCLGRRDVTLLNYNAFLHDLLSFRWVQDGYGQNPLGEDRERACFHILPLYAKVKLLHCLCEWRLERPDVETLTKDLDGDSLRVVPLGQDQKNATYWYFYGTRLYLEELIQHKSPKKSEGSADKATPASRGGRKKRRRRNNSYVVKKSKGSSKKRKLSTSSSTDDVTTLKKMKEDETSTPQFETDVSRQPKEENEDEEQENDDQGDTLVFQHHLKPKLEPELPADNASGSLSFPATPASVNSTTTALPGIPNLSTQDDSIGFNDMIKRIYSHDDDDGDDSDRKSDGPSTSGVNASGKLPTVKSESDMANGNVTLNEDGPNGSVYNGQVKLKKPYIPIGPPPWDQPELRPPDSAVRGWSLICSTMEEWRNLADSFAKPKGKNEAALFEILNENFLPSMQGLFEQKEKDRQKKLAELTPRRASDRLEVKRLQKEREEKILAEREKKERELLAKADDERQRRTEQEKREQRVRLRQLEKEKRSLIKERAKEERSRRLELRQRRQQLIAEGKDIPEDLLNATAGPNFLNDQELNEIDIEIELEHMYGQLEKLIDQLKESEDAEPFIEPVKEEIAPDYYQVIEKPMCITKIEDKLLFREYKNKGEFIEDINLMLLNCLKYNGLQSEYTKIAQNLERTFIKAWKRFFPPSDLEDSGEDARQEELYCISLLGALDAKIKEDLTRVEVEEKSKRLLDKKEMARERKREADRRRRRIKAEEKRAQQEGKRAQLAADKDKWLASQSLSSLTSPASNTGTPKRRTLPAPFLVGRSSFQSSSKPTQILQTTPSAGGQFLPKSGLQQGQLNSKDQHLLPARPAGGTGLRTYIPGISNAPPRSVNLSRGHLQKDRIIPPRSTPVYFSQTPGSLKMAPITVQSAAASTKIIKVPEGGLTATGSAQSSSSAGQRIITPAIVPSQRIVTPAIGTNGVTTRIPSENERAANVVKPATIAATSTSTPLRMPNNAVFLNTNSGTRLVRLVTQTPQQQIIPGIRAYIVQPGTTPAVVNSSPIVPLSAPSSSSAGNRLLILSVVPNNT